MMLESSEENNRGWEKEREKTRKRKKRVRGKKNDCPLRARVCTRLFTSRKCQSHQRLQVRREEVEWCAASNIDR